MKNYGEFEEAVQEGTTEPGDEAEQGEGFIRAKMPRRGEFIGVILQRLGGNRMEVKSSDGKSRNCRVPGRFKRSMWLRPKDFVIIAPWPDDDSKGDVLFKYPPSQITQLRKKGLLINLADEF